MKLHLYKFLLSIVRGLVLTKRAIVRAAGILGRLFVWVFKPTVPFLMVPLYNIFRRLARAYEGVSENPTERKLRVLLSQPALLLFVAIITISVSHAASNAASSSGSIAGARSILFTTLLVKGESDWQGEEILTPDNPLANEPAPSIIFHNGGSIARVFPYGGVVGKAPVTQEPQPEKKPTPPIQKYAVQRNDTVARIAQKFRLKQETILAANKLTRTATLRAGDVITIPAVDGVLYTVQNGGTAKDVARKFGLQATAVALANNISATDALKKGQVLVIPGVKPVLIADAKPIAPAPKPVVVKETAPPEKEQTVGTTPPTDDVPAIEPPPQPTTTPVTPRPPLASGEKMLWPTTRHSITQYYSARHPGNDIDGDYSDQIYASDDGTVISSGWNNSGYGNMILIDHGNGIQTRYGHCSKVFVRVGQEVHKGDVIAMVGTTGRSTGTHLHFEVIINGRRMNPLKYIR